MSIKKIKKKFRGFTIYSWLLIFLGSISWSLTMIKSGLIYSYGMGFWGPNGHDGVWHIALSESLARGSWQMPVFAGETIKNYHIGFDLVLAWLSKLTLIPIHTLYFQILPPVLSILIGIYAYKLVFVWRKSKIEAFWVTFFVYFAGSFGWMVNLLREGKLGGESMFWSQESISTLINPPFALSILLLFMGLRFLVKGLRNESRKQLFISTFIFGILIQIKVYAGLLILFSLFIAAIWRMIKRKGVLLMKVFLGSLIISIVLFSPLESQAGTTIVYQPFWFLETMMGVSDRLNWPRFYEAMIAYKQGSIWFKVFAAYSVALFIFIIGNLGTRIISLGWFYGRIRNFPRVSYISVIFTTIVLVGFTIPMFFVQSGTPWNTIQFVYFSLIFSAMLSGITFGKWLQKRSKLAKTLSIIILVLFTIPTSIGTLTYVYLPSRPPAKVAADELDALNFLKNQSEGVVLTYPYDALLARQAENNPPRPLYLYESTAYVSAFSNKPVFLEDEVNLDITGYDWRDRRNSVIKFYESMDKQMVWNFLRENNISYIYWVHGQRATLGESQLGIEKIYENRNVNIYKVM